MGDLEIRTDTSVDTMNARRGDEIHERPSPTTLRHRLRLSVRALIVLVLIVGGWLGWLVRGARIQREAVTAIRRAGGWVYYDRQRRGDLQYDPFAEPGGPRWLVDRVGVDYFSSPVYVTFVMQRPDDGIMAPIARLGRIERLELSGPKVTDAGLVHLGELC